MDRGWGLVFVLVVLVREFKIRGSRLGGCIFSVVGFSLVFFFSVVLFVF